MFAIKPAVPQDYAEMKECYEKTGKPFSLSASHVVVVSRDESGFAGLGVAVMNGDEAEVDEIIFTNPDDFAMSIFIGKALLNSLDLRGVKTVLCRGAHMEKTLVALRFSKTEEGVWRLSLEGYFKSGCKNAQ